MKRSAESLDERYRTGDVPWDTGRVNPHLEKFITGEQIKPCRVIDIGTGTGTNATWLAKRGFTVTGLDLSPYAIDLAREKAGVNVTFQAADFLKDDLPAAAFDLAYDRGCFHTFDDPDDRLQFAGRVHNLLTRNGLWFSVIGSTDGPTRTTGPPRLSACQITEALEPYFEIRYLKAVSFEKAMEGSVMGWACLGRKRSDASI